ncbi:hypothetical protein B566_EDAN006886 [Ephemera danica]|nr:hypothetical protein B566_EDAN006886 [Ephemera danica]
MGISGAAAPEFSQHSVIRPRVFYGRKKREIASTRNEDGQHVHDIVVNIADNEGRDWLLDLKLNRDLLPKSYFEKYQHQGRDVITRPTVKDIDLCHYQGSVRGIPDSWAAISTCKGLSGVIFDGTDLHYIEPKNGNHSDEHLLYRHEHILLIHQTNGFPNHDHTPHQSHHILGDAEVQHDGNFHHAEAHRILRYKRSNEESGSQRVIRGPFNANKESRYVELVLVVDTTEYNELGSMAEVSLYCKNIANIINALYVPLNIFVSLVGVVVWTERDGIKFSPSPDTTLANFLRYRRAHLALEHPNDNAQLLTSGASLVATGVAHEMGHNFGMEHDTRDCSCPSERCIMAPNFTLYESPVCGNGFLEPGEECDCGLPEYCNNSCCNASACMLFANASCATGECCDLETCKPRRAGYKCRTADHECDLPEFCTGKSEFCPDDVFKMNGEKAYDNLKVTCSLICFELQALCYQGSCKTHSDQCRLLWGPTGVGADSECYGMNTKGNQHGNCGHNKVNHSYIPCEKENVKCGMLHCKHSNERLEFGMESVAILTQTFLAKEGNISPCRSAIVDLGLKDVDPGLVPDGAKCGPGKMCVNQKCLAVDAIQKSPCHNNCHGHGICNNKGHCHCDIGYLPPYCADIGLGGSVDSGPATDLYDNSGNTKFFVIALVAAVFLIAVPVFA